MYQTLFGGGGGGGAGDKAMLICANNGEPHVYAHKSNDCVH